MDQPCQSLPCDDGLGHARFGQVLCDNQPVHQTDHREGYSLFLYDFKYPDLSEIAYNHLLAHLDGYKVKPKFYVINFDNPRESHRCNPIHPDS